MKKIFVSVLILIHVILMSSCFGKFPYDAPYGMWRSDDPSIYLNIVAKLQMESKGIYIKDGELREVFLTFKNEPAFIIQDIDSYFYSKTSKHWVTDSSYYFDGKFEIKDEKLYYYARWSDLTGQGTGQETKTIIFEKIEEWPEF